MSEDFIFVSVHEISQDNYGSIINQAMLILNSEWPRSDTIRKRALESSNAKFPMSLILAQEFSSKPYVIGHSKISKVPSDEEAVFVESVIVHPGLRGKGLGKYLMLKTEQFCWNMGIKRTYLTTTDKQVFYSCCGYKFSEPVCAFGGSSKLNFNLNKFSSNKSPERRKSVGGQNESIKASSPPKFHIFPPKNANVPPPPPLPMNNAPPAPPNPNIPPPPPPMLNCNGGTTITDNSVNNNNNNNELDLKLLEKCEKLFALPLLPKDPPLLGSPPDLLKVDKSSSSKITKDDVSRINDKKMFMKKELNASYYF